MFEDHPSFDPPKNDLTPVWRYVDMTKLLSLVTSSTLAFVRADLLGDQWEGALTQPMVDARDEQNRLADQADITLREQHAQVLTPRPFDADIRRSLRLGVFASCWYMSETENAAMWSIYGGRGIALRSTFHALREAVRTHHGPIYAGIVKYVDYESDSYDDVADIYKACLHKRAAFAYENELRLVCPPDYSAMPEIEERRIGDDGRIWIHTRPDYPPTRQIEVALRDMLTEVVLAPDQPAWSVAPVRALLDRFGLESVPITRSRLGELPSF